MSVRQPVRQLITPHGDRKLISRRDLHRLQPRSHYPSWGSETRRWQTTGPAISTAHYPSWGSETHIGQSVNSHRDQLITPHGDRKLEKQGPAQSLQLAPHYPSWGSETLYTPRFLVWMSYEMDRNVGVFPHVLRLAYGLAVVLRSGAPCMLSKNGPVFAMPLVFLGVHWSAKCILGESLNLDIMPVSTNKL